ncbi:MAG: hypothetical protein U5J95_02200 [Balneolaceae bacterium]|nr:hypothetical protein [Balneolaceae bacterium]
MSYALRNSLILLVVLVLFIAGGWGYISYFQAPKISDLEQKVSQKTTELQEKQQVANQYETVLNQFENAKFYINNFDKVLYQNNNEDEVFDYLNTLNSGSSYTDFAFSFNDSTAQGQYGIIRMNITGSGYYRYLINFIRQIEYSQPLNKISQVNITPMNAVEDYGKVDYSFVLESYYDRVSVLEPGSFEISENTYASLYNPFYPLIRNIQPNTEDLINIEQSSLLALSSEKAFILDQNGVMQQINIGDKVYLGSLKTVNLNEGTAKFELNKGGIIEVITLEVQQ